MQILWIFMRSQLEVIFANAFFIFPYCLLCWINKIFSLFISIAASDEETDWGISCSTKLSLSLSIIDNDNQLCNRILCRILEKIRDNLCSILTITVFQSAIDRINDNPRTVRSIIIDKRRIFFKLMKNNLRSIWCSSDSCLYIYFLEFIYLRWLPKMLSPFLQTLPHHHTTHIPSSL